MMIRFLPWFLSVVLALSSATMASARGQMVQGDAIVICSGYGIVTIVLGPDGEPVGSVHPCPDCTPHLAAVLPAAGPAALRPLTRAEPVRVGQGAVAPAPAAPPPQARAPPGA
ncbi:MAG: hypothetical protein MUC82_16225 [Cypionkella sp.]|jgi:hypothetical protein|nr:hypothetical protein [Cypionkella sp.]